MKVRKVLLTLIIIVLLINVIGLLTRRRIKSSEGEGYPGEGRVPVAQNLEPAQKEIMPIDAGAAFTGDLIIRVSAQGILEADKNIIIKSKVSGEVIDLPVWEGKRVKKGDLLFAINDSDYRLALKEAESKYALASINYVLQGGGSSERVIVDSNLTSGNERGNLYKRFIKRAEKEWDDVQGNSTGNSGNNGQFDLYKRNLEVSLILTGKRD